MSVVQTPSGLFEELAELFASGPTLEQVLDFRPSKAVEARARELLEKQDDALISAEEERELDQFEQAEMLMRLVKARIHARRAP
jgi:hypothetical protein